MSSPCILALVAEGLSGHCPLLLLTLCILRNLSSRRVVITLHIEFGAHLGCYFVSCQRSSARKTWRTTKWSWSSWSGTRAVRIGSGGEEITAPINTSSVCNYSYLLFYIKVFSNFGQLYVYPSWLLIRRIKSFVSCRVERSVLVGVHPLHPFPPCSSEFLILANPSICGLLWLSIISHPNKYIGP